MEKEDNKAKEVIDVETSESKKAKGDDDEADDNGGD